MLCKNCGGTLAYSDGLYICGSCGSQYAVTDFYEDIDTYVCYVEADESGRRTKDSILAQEIYRTLEQAKIKTFYARISADKLSGTDLERACNAALHSAKTVLILGTQKQHFEVLIEKYSAFYAGKIIIPVYADMDAYGIPKGISAIQALDYNKVGAGVDLTKSINNALGREQELDYAALTQKVGAKKKAILWGIIAVLAAAILGFGAYCLAFGLPGVKEPPETTQPTLETTETTQPTLSLEEIQENQYIEAVACADSGDYVRAVELFIGLPGYKDSEKRLNTIYQRYAGYYKSETEGITFRLQVWEGDVGVIELSKITSSGARCVISESFQLQGNLQSVEFNDSENNQGQISLQLSNDGVVINVNTTNAVSDVSVGSFQAAFLLAEKSDKPFTAPLDRETLLGFVRNRVTLSQLTQLGYEMEFASALYKDTSSSVYGIKNTDIYLAVYSFDVSSTEYFGDESENAVDDPIVFAVSAPASVIIPDKVGTPIEPFVEDEILFVPGGGLSQNYRIVEFGLPEYNEQGDTTSNTNVCFTSKSLIGSMHYEDLALYYLGYEVRERAISEYKATFFMTHSSVFADIVAENSTCYLVSVISRPTLYSDDPLAYYKVDKETKEIQFIAQIPYSDSFDDPGYVFKNYPELFGEFL